jgi:hypothetical protein
MSDIDTARKRLGEVLREELARRAAQIEARLAAMEVHVRELKYVGPWTAQQRSFKRGNFASHNGSLWHCEQDGATSRPGSDSSWRLCVKSGQPR